MRLVIFFALASCLIGCSMAAWPKGVTPCRATTDLTAYNKCLDGLMNKIHPLMANGIREANVPKLDPYELNHIKVDHELSAVKIHADVTKIRVIGATNFKVLELRGDPQKLTLHIKVKMPRVRSWCDYDAKGSLLTASLNMKGRFQGNFTDTVITADGVGEKKGNKLAVKSLKVKVHVGDGKIKLSGNGSKNQAAAAAVQFLYDLSPRTVLDTITPIFEVSAKGILLGMLKDALETFTVDQLIPN